MEKQRKKRPGQLPSPKELEDLKELFRHHIESFDYMVDEGLELMLKRVKPVQIFDPFSNQTLRIWLENPVIYPPQKERSSKTLATELLPFECRQAKISYTGSLLIDVRFQYGDSGSVYEKINFGEFPIMSRSKRCCLREADPAKLVACKEESAEMGGYFILNGLERVVRLLILPKRNYPMSLVRNSFRERREGYTDKAVVIRCVREDLSSVTVKLYYLHNGSARLGFRIQWREYMLTIVKYFALVFMLFLLNSFC